MSIETGLRGRRGRSWGRWIGWGLVAWLGCTLAALLLLHFLHVPQRTYTGTARFSRQTDPAAEELMRTQSESADTLQRTLEYQLAGREAVERAVEELGLTDGMPRDPAGQLTSDGQMKKQALVRDVTQHVKVTFEVSSPTYDLVAVRFTDGDPGLAQRMPDTLVKNYIDLKSKQIVDNLATSRKFLEVQVNKCNDFLAHRLSDQIEFRKQYAGIVLDSPDGLFSQIQEVQNEIETLRRQEDAARQGIERDASHSSPTTAPDIRMREPRGPNPEHRLAALQNVMENFTPIHMRHRDLDRLVAEARAETDLWQGRLRAIQMTLEAELAKRRTHLRVLELAEPQFEPDPQPIAQIVGIAAASALVLVVVIALLVLSLHRAKWLTLLCLLLLAGILLVGLLIAYPEMPGLWHWELLKWVGTAPQG